MNKCKFNLAWVGNCNESTTDNDLCDKHKKEKCCSCGEQATRECSETMGLVCGAPLCDNCEHTIRKNGCNSGAELPEGLKGHCKKDEQVYKLWMERDNPLDIYRNKPPLSDRDILENYGWVIECESPYEVRHEDGSFASGQAVSYLIDSLKEEFKEE